MLYDDPSSHSPFVLLNYSITNQPTQQAKKMEKEKTSFYTNYIPPKSPRARLLTPTKFRPPKLLTVDLVKNPLSASDPTKDNTIRTPSGRVVSAAKMHSQFEIAGEKKMSNPYPSIYPRHITPKIAVTKSDEVPAFHWTTAEKLGTSSKSTPNTSRQATTITSPKTSISTGTSSALDYGTCVVHGSRVMTPTKYRRIGGSRTPSANHFDPNVYIITQSNSSMITAEYVQPLAKVGRLLTPTKYREGQAPKTEDDFLYANLFLSGVSTPIQDTEKISKILEEGAEDSWSSITPSDHGQEEPAINSALMEKSAGKNKSSFKVTFNDSVAIREPTPTSMSSSRKCVKFDFRAQSAPSSLDDFYARKWQVTNEDSYENELSVDEVKQVLESNKAQLLPPDYETVKTMLANVNNNNVKLANFMKQYIEHLLLKSNYELLQGKRQIAISTFRRPVSLRHPEPEWRFYYESKSLAKAKSSALEMAANTTHVRSLRKVQSVECFTGAAADLQNTFDQDDLSNPGGHRRCVFISYSQVQKGVAEAIWRKLSPIYDVWFDETHLTAWTPDPVENGVQKADLAIVCYSDSYNKSVNCENEASVIAKLQKPVMLICAEQEYEPDGWLQHFIQEQQQQTSVITLVDPVPDEDLDSLLTDIEHLMP